MSLFFGKFAGKLIMALAVVLALIFGVVQCHDARTAGQETRVVRGQAGAVTDSAADAIGAVGGLHGRDQASDDLTKENKSAILSAPGAGALVAPAVHGAGRDSLCRRAAYRGSLDCVQRSTASGVAGAGAGSAASVR